MILVKPSFEIMGIMYSGEGMAHTTGALSMIEIAGRTCYKSEDKITFESSKKFVQSILKRGHESVIEHSAMTVKFICDRGVTHELVRHRLCAFSQESTRYVNYRGGCTFVIPPWINDPIYLSSTDMNYSSTVEYNAQEVYNACSWCSTKDHAEVIWLMKMAEAELAYSNLTNTVHRWSPQQARSVLPNSTKTEIVVTANFHEWHHIFKLRCAKAAHPQMREIMIPLLEKCKELIPIIFDDIQVN